MARNRTRQREKEREKKRQKRIDKMIEKGIAAQKQKEFEAGWQYVNGDVRKFDVTPFRAIIGL